MGGNVGPKPLWTTKINNTKSHDYNFTEIFEIVSPMCDYPYLHDIKVKKEILTVYFFI